MILHVQKHPSPALLASCEEKPDNTPAPEGWEAMSVEAFNQWRDAEIANGWAPPAPEPVPEPVPQEVTRRQFFLAVHSQLGLTRAALRAQIGTESALIDFDEAQSFKRDYPLLLALAAQLGYTEAQIDQLFQLANTL